jgi:protein TonB
MELDENKIIVVLAAVASLLLNLLAFHLFNPRRASAAMDDYKLIELVDLPKQEVTAEKKPEPPDQARQVVDLGPANPDDQTPPPPDPRYLSERNMRTDRETVRPSFDRTGSGGATPPLEKARPRSEPAKKPRTAGQPIRVADAGMMASPSSEQPADRTERPARPLSKEDLKINMSDLEQEFKPDNGSIDYLPTAMRSDVTSLNAMQYAYASFYNRIKKIIRFYWEPQAALAGIRWTGGSLQTRLRIVVESDGTLTKVEVVQSCGYPVVDAAAIRAVSKAAPFYNVPPALLNDNKQLDEVWAFYIVPQ